MRVLELCVRYPPAPGGVETHVRELAERLRARGRDVRVFTSDLYTETPWAKLTSCNEDAAFVQRFPAYSLGGELHYVFQRGLFRRLLREPADVMHAHSYGYFHTNLAAWTRKLREVPLVLTPHFHPHWSMVGGSKRKKLRLFYDRRLAQYVLGAADALVFVSRAERGLLKECVGLSAQRVEIIPNGIAIEEFKNLPPNNIFRERYEIFDPYVLFVGRLAVNKGLHVLVQAMPEVLKECPRVRFVLAGEDMGVAEGLRALAAKLDVRENLHMLGHLSRELLLSAYAGCELFVLPSQFEAFGIVLLEAMAAGKACIGTRVGGIPELLGEGSYGVLVEYGDRDALAEALLKLLCDPRKRRAFARKAQERVTEFYTWDKVVESLEKLYLSLLAR
jgi:glycosyltransferase involved in cell wall biosynthesis